MLNIVDLAWLVGVSCSKSGASIALDENGEKVSHSQKKKEKEKEKKGINKVGERGGGAQTEE